MKLQLRFTRSGRKFKLWQLLLAIAVVAVVLALLPQRIGVPIFLAIEGTLILCLLMLLGILVLKKLIGSMNAQQKQGWASLKSAEKAFRAWAASQGISVERVAYVATFEDWDSCTGVYVFFSQDSDLQRHKTDGMVTQIEARYRQMLSDAKYPFERWPVVFTFDSRENVVKNYEGNYFYRLR